MCLYTTSKKIQTATKDITVYKIGHHNLHQDGLVSPYYKFHYKWNTLYKEEPLVIETYAGGVNEVLKGFHAYTEHILMYNQNYIHYAIIPKGAEYCVGLDGDIVSNQIIVFKDETQYLLSKLKRLIKL